MTPENRPPGLGKAVTAQFGMVLIVGAFVLPYAHLLLTSFKPPTEVLAIPPTFIPSRFELTNYVSALSDPGIQLVIEALGRLRYGAIQLTVHEGRLVQVDVTERNRFAAS